MSAMTKEEKRQLFLTVKDAWTEITANFAEKGVTRATRAAAWQKVFDECRSKGHAWTNGRDSKWLSGNKWPGIVKEVKERADKNRKTGSGGDTKLSELDEMVLDIIGRNSAGVKGIDVPDSGEGKSAESEFLAKSLAASGSSSSPPYTQATQSVVNFIPKSQFSESPLATLTPMSSYKLPRKKRPLQASNEQSVDDDEDEVFRRKMHQWLDGLLRPNEQQGLINEMKIKKLRKELAEDATEEMPAKDDDFDLFGDDKPIR